MTEAVERIEITGRVQGVAYRKWAQDAARSLGLRGFVRNRSDGSV
ncbi:acylphosphatase, partial [Hansschlegelia beijingensis]